MCAKITFNDELFLFVQDRDLTKSAIEFLFTINALDSYHLALSHSSDDEVVIGKVRFPQESRQVISRAIFRLRGDDVEGSIVLFDDHPFFDIDEDHHFAICDE